MPFANERRVVSGRLQQRRQQHRVRRKVAPGILRPVTNHSGDAGRGRDNGRSAAPHVWANRRRNWHGSCRRLCPPSQTVDVGSVQVLGAKGGIVAPPEIIGQDHDEVRPRLPRHDAGCQGGQRQRPKTNSTWRGSFWFAEYNRFGAWKTVESSWYPIRLQKNAEPRASNSRPGFPGKEPRSDSKPATRPSAATKEDRTNRPRPLPRRRPRLRRTRATTRTK